jgi:hypothetical protein
MRVRVNIQAPGQTTNGGENTSSYRTRCKGTPSRKNLPRVSICDSSNETMLIGGKLRGIQRHAKKNALEVETPAKLLASKIENPKLTIAKLRAVTLRKRTAKNSGTNCAVPLGCGLPRGAHVRASARLVSLRFFRRQRYWTCGIRSRGNEYGADRCAGLE